MITKPHPSSNNHSLLFIGLADIVNFYISGILREILKAVVEVQVALDEVKSELKSQRRSIQTLKMSVESNAMAGTQLRDNSEEIQQVQANLPVMVGEMSDMEERLKEKAVFEALVNKQSI